MMDNTFDIFSEKWHALAVQESADRLSVDVAVGLSSDEVQKRRARYGPNRIAKKKGTPVWLRFLLQFHQPLIYILLVASLVTLFLREWVDGGVILAVVLVNTIIGFLQEAKALGALDALSRTMTTPATVLRDGKETRIPSTELVPGDVVLVGSGDKIPADMRLYQSRELQVNESALTGESLAAQKKPEPVDPAAGLADRPGMLYASTLVTYGQGRGLVTATGERTEVGRISELISTAEDLATPLTKKIAHFSHFLLYVILGMAGLTFLVGMLRGGSFMDMFMASVALAVGAIPEGLPAVVTITLAIGVTRMARRHAIIRKLPAVETLGSAMIICSDKTGTLTENQMTVQKIMAGGQTYEVTGTGYAPEGQIQKNSAAVPMESLPALRECLTAGLLCNDSRRVQKDQRYEIEGDPTEGALIVAAHKGGLQAGLSFGKRLDSIPFESEHRYMATLHAGDVGKKPVIYMKGAVEKILERCEVGLGDNGRSAPLDKQQVLEWTKEMASQGLRVLAFASAERSLESTSIHHEDVRAGMTFLGLQAMMDPPRKEAIRAVQSCHTAGIRVSMITGDHVLTATAIAKQLGLRRDPKAAMEELVAVTGKDMEHCSEQEFTKTALRASVFARVTPEQKLKLVRALQSHGNIVAMTGDGVNDAPALKQANIGVAMGLGGTEVAKEAADMVLADDNFASIEAAVEEGRCVFDNLWKFIVWSMPTNLAEGLAIMLAVFAGTLLPLLPVQILWINMTTAIFLGLMLAFEPKEPDIMSRPPRDPQKPIMTRGMTIRTLYVGFMLVAGVFSLFLFEKQAGATIEQARTAAAGMLVMGELFYLFNCRSLNKSMIAIGLFSNKRLFGGVAAMIALQMLFTYWPVMNRLFHSAPISVESWLRILGISAVIYTTVSLEKSISRRMRSAAHTRGYLKP